MAVGSLTGEPLAPAGVLLASSSTRSPSCHTGGGENGCVDESRLSPAGGIEVWSGARTAQPARQSFIINWSS